ncbi:MAG: flagellar basal-body MS-ring/collar protein FliF [Bacillota bacterium]|nr:flagellar basal-body MS-ring/collar protein FliF [Bacillota bacterium]
MATSAVVAGARERWQALSPVQRIALGMAVAGVIAAVIYVAGLIGQYRYAPLFSGLAPGEAGAIVAKLKELQVPYRLTDQGTTVQVPRDQVYETRIQLASSGALNAGGLGFELFDKTKLGITEFEQQVNYQRALQGELQRTIVQLEEVEQARVHLVIPKKTVFDEEQPEPSASVALKLKPLTQLKPEQVQGIVALVTGSVEGLKPENVHVIDMEGRILSDEAGSDQVASAGMTQQQVKRSYEKELEKRVQQMLERVLGPGKAVCMVSADLDFSRTETVINVPEGEGVVVSEQTSREQGGAGAAGGTAGTGGNFGYETPTPGGNQGYTREDTTRNYQVGTRQETIVQAPGVLRRLSTAVVVDGDLTPAKRQEIEQLVATAVGFNPERGDQVTISAMGFDNTYQKQLAEDEAKAAAAAKKAQEQRVLTYAIAGAAGLLLLIVFGLLFMLRRRRRAAMPAVEGLAPGEPGEDEGPMKPPPRRTDAQEEKMRELARERPQEVADIIKVWLKEE